MGRVVTVDILSIVGVERIASIGIPAFVGIGVVLCITINGRESFVPVFVLFGSWEEF
jgi:hypothetical protein